MKFFDSYRCKDEKKNDETQQWGINAFIVERMDGSMWSFFVQVARHLTDSHRYSQARNEIDKIFSLVEKMNADGIYHRDANRLNLMYMKTTPNSSDVIWKFIDPESFYLVHNESAGLPETLNGPFGLLIPGQAILDDLKDKTRHLIGVDVDLLSIAVALVRIDKRLYQLFPSWVKKVIQDAKKIPTQSDYLLEFPTETF